LKVDVQILVVSEGVAGLLQLREEWCFGFPAVGMGLETAVDLEKGAASLENGVLVQTGN
jgi:hypothetical protein